MKFLLPLAVAVGSMLGLSSCCCMFNKVAKAEYETVQKRVCGTSTVTEQVWVPGPTDPKSGMASGSYQTVEREVVKYKNVKRKVPCKCYVWYCPEAECCGTTGSNVMRLASAQGWSGSPNIGLIPTMKPLAP